MKRKLFLTGVSGCGKSTLLQEALQEKQKQAGGFLTVRERDTDGKVLGFDLVSVHDIGKKERFLDFTKDNPVRCEVFTNLGVELLEKDENTAFFMMDEIGGIELLDQRFKEVLFQVLLGDLPCIGVLKGDAPASKLIETLGLGEVYRQTAAELHSFMLNAEDIEIVETTGKTDERARLLVEEWVREYANGTVF